MKIDFPQLMASKSEQELDDYIENRTKYIPEAIEAAISELKTRGVILSKEKLEVIKQDLERKRIDEIKETDNLFGEKLDKNLVTDSNTPQFYTKRAIWGFSVFFTAIFGAILFSLNLSDRKTKGMVLGFGIIYTIAAALIREQLSNNSVITFLFNGLGAFILTSLFWDKYIGSKTQYRAKPIWKPLIIGILIMIPFIIAGIYYGTK